MLVAVQGLSAQTISDFREKLDRYQFFMQREFSVGNLSKTPFDTIAFLSVFDQLHLRKSSVLGLYSSGRPFSGYTIYGIPDTFLLEQFIRNKTISMIAHDTLFETKITHFNADEYRVILKPVKTGNYSIRYDSLSYKNNYSNNLKTLLAKDAYQAYQVMAPADNAQGYFQYFYLRQYSYQFCGECVANYNIKEIIWDEHDFSAFISRTSRADFSTLSAYRRFLKLKKFDPSPWVVLHSDCCEIRVVESEDSGVFKRVYTIKRGEPYEMKLQIETKLAAFESNVII